MLFPAGFATLAAGEGAYHWQVSQSGADVVITGTRGVAKLVVTSPTADWSGPDGNPVRCAKVGRPLSAAGPVVVNGALSSITVTSADGRATIDGTSPLLAERNPSGLRTLARDELRGSIVLSKAEAEALVAPGAQAGKVFEPHTQVFGDSGVTVRSRWAGSVDTGIYFIMQYEVEGVTRGVAHSIRGINCNVPAGMDTTVGDVAVESVLLTGGARLFVDGAEVTDRIPEPAFQGEFGLVAVTRSKKHVKVEVRDRSGKVLHHWTQEYRSSGD